MVDKSIGIIVAFISLTALALVISKKANTVAVLNSLLSGIRGLQQTAIKPVVG